MGTSVLNCPVIARLITIFLMLASLNHVPGGDPTLAPDLIIHNAVVRTMVDDQPQAEAVAILGNRIAAVGASKAIRPLAGRATRLIDAQGKLVLPGFNDAHVHFLSGGFSLADVDLRDAASPEELVRRLKVFAQGLPKGRWILGGNWDHEKWIGAPLPTRQMIDSVTPEHPVLISRLDGHMVLANSVALKLGGVTKDTKDPPGGLIVREPTTGEPTGILKDAAENLVARILPPRTFEEKLTAARAATAQAARFGVTSLQDMSGDDDLGLYQYLQAQGALKNRLYAARSIVSWEVLRKTGLRAPFGDALLRIGGLKGFSDGSLGSSTALFFEPYNDAPNQRGLLGDQMLPEGVMLQRVLAADRAGLQIMIHAIGDEANQRILDLFKQAAEKNGLRDRRFRIEHAQHLRQAEIPRFGQQKVIASMQPYHAADDGRWCEKRLGAARSQTTYAFRSLLDSGAVLAFGTDWPVAPLNPLLGIHAAVTRRTLDGKHPNGWIPGQKITVAEAVRAYTAGAAYAEFTEQQKGIIAPGKLADLVVLDQDIFQIEPTALDKVRVLLTVMDGKIVYEASLR